MALQESCHQWAQKEFSNVSLGDKRNDKRLLQLAAALVEIPSGTMCSIFKKTAELKAAYRFMDHESFGITAIQETHRKNTQDLLCKPGQYILIEDTTCLDFTNHSETKGLGFIGDGKGRGLLMHTNLAFRIDSQDTQGRLQGVCLGILHQEIWTRQEEGLRKESWRSRQNRKRESQRWGRCLPDLKKPKHSQWIYVADRESDIYEPMEESLDKEIDFVIRGFHNRALAGNSSNLFDALNKAEIIGSFSITVRANKAEAMREAAVKVRSCRVTIQGVSRPEGRKKDLTVNAVELFEESPPASVKKPVRWLLLTTLKCDTFEEVMQVAAIYTYRWNIEEYHKCLKTGATAEASQLEQAYRLENVIAILAVVSVRLLNMKFMARSQPEHILTVEELQSTELKILEKMLGKPKGPWTNKTAWIAVARLGGFPGRKGDGMPGWITIWRGWQRLRTMCEAIELLGEEKCG